MSQPSEQGFNPQELIGFLQRNLHFIVAGLLFGCLAGILFAFSQTPQYQSAMTLQFSDQKKSGMSAESVLDFNRVTTMGAAGAAINAAIPILQSRVLAEDIVKKLALNAELTNVSDIGYIKKVQRKMRYWINPPESLQYMGWSGKARFYLAGMVGNPGPVGSLIINDLRVDSALQSKVLTLKLGTDESHFDVEDELNKNTVKCTVGEVCLLSFQNGSISFVPVRIKAGLDTRIMMSFRSLDAAATLVRTSITMEPFKQAGSGFMTVSCKWSDPVLAQAMLDVLASAYSMRDQRETTRSYDQTLEFLDANIGPMEASLEDAEKRLRAFLEKHNVLDMPSKYSQGMSSISDMEKQQLESELHKKSLEYLAKIIDKADPTAYGSLVAEVSPDLAREWEQLQQRSMELDVEGQSLNGFTNQYPRMKKHLLAVEALKQRKDDLKKKALEGIKNKQQLQLEKDKAITASINNVARSMGLDSDTQIEFLRLTRHKMVAEKLYVSFFDKREQMRISKAGELASMQVLDSPLPGNQVWPKMTYITMIGGILGLLLAGLITFVREKLNISLKDPGQIERITGLYVHGLIPAHKEAEENEGLVTIMRPTSVDAEAYRTLRTSIQLSSLENHVRSIMITSSGPGEGKSTTLANLAVTLAQAGIKTLIVDCDMRRPTLNKLLKIEREPGLSEVLGGKLDWRTHVKPTEIENLFVLPSGKVPSNPSELLGRMHMTAILAEMKQEYSFVLCDVPPILVVSDSALLASHLDGVLILVRSGRAVADEVIRAREQMERVGGKLLGAVFNAYGGKGGGYGGYGYGYGGYYHQDQTDKKPEKKWKILFKKLLKIKQHSNKRR